MIIEELARDLVVAIHGRSNNTLEGLFVLKIEKVIAHYVKKTKICCMSELIKHLNNGIDKTEAE